MTSTRGSKNSDKMTEDFSWDSLPDVAKERWEEMVAYSSTVENQLSKAKASRAQAETERQRIATETLRATKDACRAVVADSKRAITKLKSQVAETEENYAESLRQLEPLHRLPRRRHCRPGQPRPRRHARPLRARYRRRQRYGRR